MSDGITDAEADALKTYELWQKSEIRKFLSDRTMEELLDELAKREGVTIHKITKNEEGVINKYIPCGFQGMEKKSENLQWGIYGGATILVIEK